jgi:hypothetical protein
MMTPAAMNAADPADDLPNAAATNNPTAATTINDPGTHFM